jgi:hypothetical protein
VGDIRPSDGCYALCYDALDPARPILVVDLDTGKSICSATLPLTWKNPGRSSSLAHAGRVYWISDQEVLCTGRFLNSSAGVSYHWWRLNYQTGEILADGNPRSIPLQGAHYDLEPQKSIPGGNGAVTENGGHLFVVGGGGKGSPPDVAGQIHLRTFQTTDLGRIDRPFNGPFGLVPGGKYFYLGLHIYDRRSLNLVAAKNFPDDRAEIRAVTFSPDGSRYAASLWHHGLEKQPRAAVLVHETLTPRILTAFTPSTGASLLRFSQDGTRLAVAYDDGTLELRSVPASQIARPVMPR